MYPQEELKLLSLKKAALRQRIHVQRAECAAAFTRISRPLQWLDRVIAQWRKLSPMLKLGAVPLVLLLKRWIAPRTRILGSVLRWGPLVYGAVRGFAATRKMAHRS
jgi:hypothetical protein